MQHGSLDKLCRQVEADETYIGGKARTGLGLCPRDLLHRARAHGLATRLHEKDAEDSERGLGPGPQTHEGDRAMRKRTTKKAGIGSTFDNFLKDEGTYEATQSVAIKRVLAWQIEKAMKKQRLTKAEMARRMETSRSQLDRLLDPDSDSVTLETLTRAAHAIGRQVKLELV
jgi:predicted XRE-type DNA-binding protein